MSAFDDLAAATQAVLDAYKLLLDELDAEQAQHAVDNQQNSARIAALQAELDECQNPPAPTPTHRTLIGMSAPENLWDQRVAEVGPGLKARRIFNSSIRTDGLDKQTVIQSTVADGLIPVVSYKCPNGDVAGGISGQYDTNFKNAAAFLAGLSTPVYVTVHHEPYDNMTGSQFVALHKRIAPFFKKGQVKIGIIHNAWLVDNKIADFESYFDSALLDLWDYFGFDTYESGTATSPGKIKPADRVDPIVASLGRKGHADMPLLVGEYNGWSAATVKAAGDKFLATPTMDIACVFNSTTGNKGLPLTGDRLTAFKQTLAEANA